MSPHDSLAPLEPQDAPRPTYRPEGLPVVRGIKIEPRGAWDDWTKARVSSKDPDLNGKTWLEIHDSPDPYVLEALRRVVAQGAEEQGVVTGSIHHTYQSAALVLEARDPSPPEDLEL